MLLKKKFLLKLNILVRFPKRGIDNATKSGVLWGPDP
jgi:hypothetical protein